jgi:hypothetical protein
MLSIWAFASLAVLVIILLELRGQRSASDVRSIIVHLTGAVIPMLEQRGYRIERKQVCLGRSPYAKFNMSSDFGLWIDIYADSESSYFSISSMKRAHGVTLNLMHRFEVSGPWDELTPCRIAKFERSFQDWTSEPADLIHYYLPHACHYVTQGGGTGAPSDLGYKLWRRIDQASPHERYPLIPLLPRP